MGNIHHLESNVQRAVTQIIRDEVKDDLGFITITGVKITNELSFMYIYYTVFGDEEQLDKSQQALERAKGFIKTQIAHHVKMRKVPELIFKHDETYDKGRRVDDLINSLK